MCCGHQSKCSCKEHGNHHCSCGCHGHTHLGPDFWTKDEKIAWLQEKLDKLMETVKYYEERIEALQSEA